MAKQKAHASSDDHTRGDPRFGIPSIDYRTARSWRETFGETLFSFPAAVHARTSTTNLLDMAKTRGPAVDPTVFDDHPPFMAAAEVSSNRVDAYFTRMMPSSLQNYAQDYTDGVSVLASHDTRSIFGRSLTGAYAGAQGNGVARATSEFYTVPGLTIGDANSDQMILGIRSGILQDISNGFYGGECMCSICGMDLWSWDCPHMPGVKYGADGKRDSSGSVCIGNIEDAHSAEFSLVYDGATPGAGLLKGQQLAATGRIRDADRSWLEMRYRVHVPLASQQWRGTDVGARQPVRDQDEEEADMSEETRATPPAEQAAPPNVHERTVEAVKRVLGSVTYPTDVADDIEARVTWLTSEHNRLVPLADDGRTYRADLVTSAIEEGVRALGKDFSQETYKDLLERSSVAVIKRMRDDWKSTGDSQFKGGRATIDTEVQSTNTDQLIPAAAFRSGR